MRAFRSPSWKIRRRVIVTTMAFCMGCIGYLLFEGTDTKVGETIALGAFGLLASTVGSYIFGAAWDDKNHRCLEPEAGTE